MSTPTIDYDALAAQHGGTPAVDYDALAAQHGGVAQSSAPTTGRLNMPMHQAQAIQAQAIQAQAIQAQNAPVNATSKQNELGSIFPAAGATVGGLVGSLAGPVGTAAGGAYGAVVGQRAKTRFEGQPSDPEAEMKAGILGAIPGVGEDAIPALAEAIPTRAKAGQLFDQVMQAAKDQPVNLTRSQAPLERIAQLTDAGGPTLPGPNKLMLRSQSIAPIPYQEARDFYSNISNLSAQDKMALNGPMQKAVNDLRAAFKDDIGDTAAGSGKGELYYKAMKQYQAAMKAQNIAKTAGKYAVKTGATAAGLGATYSVLDMLRDILR